MATKIEIPTVSDKLKSDRLWVCLAYLALVAAGPHLGIGPELMLQAAGVAGAFILGKSWRPSGAISGAQAPQDAPQD